MPFTLTLAVRDLDRTELFYRDILELQPERFIPLPGAPPALLLRLEDAVILLRPASVLESRHPALFQSLDRHPFGTGMMLEFSVQSLTPVLRNITRRKLHILYELDDREFGMREIWLHDPDGYLVVLRSRSEPV